MVAESMVGVDTSKTPKPCVESSIFSAPAMKCSNHAVSRVVAFFIFTLQWTYLLKSLCLRKESERHMKSLRLNRGNLEYNAEEMPYIKIAMKQYKIKKTQEEIERLQKEMK